MPDPELDRLLSALHRDPADDLLWLAVADRLEETGEPLRAELLRLNRQLRGMEETPERWNVEDRVRELVNGGVRPCVPEIVNSIGVRFALIPAGSFWMGSPEDEAERSDDETRPGDRSGRAGRGHRPGIPRGRLVRPFLVLPVGRPVRNEPSFRDFILGFRVVFDPSPLPEAERGAGRVRRVVSGRSTTRDGGEAGAEDGGASPSQDVCGVLRGQQLLPEPEIFALLRDIWEAPARKRK